MLSPPHFSFESLPVTACKLLQALAKEEVYHGAKDAGESDRGQEQPTGHLKGHPNHMLTCPWEARRKPKLQAARPGRPGFLDPCRSVQALGLEYLGTIV